MQRFICFGFGLFVIVATGLMPMPSVSAAGASGSLTCNNATTSSITVGVTYSTGSSAAANLYRYGAPANGQIASFPGPSGVASHQDGGLAGSYRYQLRTGTTILANVTCATAVAPPAPSPAPAPAPAPTAPARPAAPAPVPAPAPVTPKPTPAPVVTPQPTPVTTDPTQPLEQVTRGSSQVLPKATEPNNDDTKNTDTTDDTNTQSSFNWWPILAGVAAGLLILGGIYLWAKQRQQTNDQSVESGPSPIVSDRLAPLSLPVPLPPTQNGVPTADYLPVPTESTTENQAFEQRIKNAFYPSRPPEPVPVESRADDVPDMYTVANTYPESFGNVHYTQPSTELPSPILNQPAAGPQTFDDNDNTVTIDHQKRT